MTQVIRPAVPRSSSELLEIMVEEVCQNLDEEKGGIGRPSTFCEPLISRRGPEAGSPLNKNNDNICYWNSWTPITFFSPSVGAYVLGNI